MERALRSVAAVGLVSVLWLACAPVAQAEPEPERVGLELGLHGSGVLNYGLDADATGGGRLTFRAAWPLGRIFRLGFRVGLLMTALPFGEQDDELWLGIKPTDPTDPYEARVVTVVPSIAILAQIKIWRFLELDAVLGLAAPLGVWKTGSQAVQVSPHWGLGLLFYVYRHPKVHVAVRVAFEAFPVVGHPRQAWMFLPMGGVLVRFPVRDKPGSLKGGDVPGPFGPNNSGPSF